MKSFISKLTSFFIFTTLILWLTSCSINSNLQFTETPVYSASQPNNDESVHSTMSPSNQSPIPSSTPVTISLLPTKGSILKWVDLSNFVYVPDIEFIMGEVSSAVSDHNTASINL